LEHVMVRVHHAGDNHMSAHVDDLVGSVGQVGGFANLFDHYTTGK